MKYAHRPKTILQSAAFISAHSEHVQAAIQFHQAHMDNGSETRLAAAVEDSSFTSLVAAIDSWAAELVAEVVRKIQAE